MAARGRRKAIGATMALGLLGITGCAREPEDVPCPDVAEGELVITEIRGPQEGADSLGQWIEVFNSTDTEIDLFGLRIGVFPLDGRDPILMLVRREEVVVPPKGYGVVGRHRDAQAPEYVDYGFRLTDNAKDLFEDAFIEVSSCDVLIDRVIYRGLTTLGTLSLDPSTEPSAKRNDEETAYCIDASESEPGATTTLGKPGTPGEANRPCED